MRRLLPTLLLAGSMLVPTLAACSSSGPPAPTPSSSTVSLDARVDVPDVDGKKVGPLFVAAAGDTLWYTMQAPGEQLNAGTFPRGPVNSADVTAVGRLESDGSAQNFSVPDDIGGGTTWSIVTIGDTAYVGVMQSDLNEPGYIISVSGSSGDPRISLVNRLTPGQDGPNAGQPYALATDGTDLFVGDVANDAIVQISTSGEFKKKFLALDTDQPTMLTDVAVSNDGETVYALGGESNQVYSFDVGSGEPLLTRTLQGDAEPVALAASPDTPDLYYIYSNSVTNATTTADPTSSASPKNGIGVIRSDLSDSTANDISSQASLFDVAVGPDYVYATVANDSKLAVMSRNSPGTPELLDYGVSDSGPYGLTTMGEHVWFAAQDGRFLGRIKQL